jgi:DNA-binding NarL/FixJ family response regulator
LLDRDASRLSDLASALESGGLVTLAAETTLAAASAGLVEPVPSLVVVDAGLSDGAAAPPELVALLRRRHPELKIVCLDDAGERRTIARLLAAGADAVFLRQSQAAELARAIRRVLRDDAVFVPLSGWDPADSGSRHDPAAPVIGV